MKAVFTLGDALDIIEKLVDGEPPPVDLAEWVEVILEGDPRAPYAHTILTFLEHPDKVAAWERFVSSAVRIYGADWRTSRFVVAGSLLLKLDQNRVLACATPGCMELAWARTCDQCLNQQLGR